MESTTNGRIIRSVDHGTPEYEETVALRHEVLLNPLGITLTPEQLGAEGDDLHAACYQDGELVGCLILTRIGENEVKMRQVAVATGMQRRGIGRDLVRYSEEYARRHGYGIISLNARETAVPFYLDLGYEVIGERFEEVSIPHWKMFRRME